MDKRNLTYICAVDVGQKLDQLKEEMLERVEYNVTLGRKNPVFGVFNGQMFVVYPGANSVDDVILYKDRNNIKKEKNEKEKEKGISWYDLNEKIGHQTIYKTKNTNVQVLVDGQLKDCKLVFKNNGNNFYLEPVE